MRVLVTGANGMLGTDLCAAIRIGGMEALPTGRHGDATKMDVTDLEGVRKALDAQKPDAVIHCAAYTNVDQAEREPDAAYKVNALGSWTVAVACAERNIPLCAVSTDFVFDGTKQEPYTEFDPPNPVSHYGASKLAGENLIRQVCPKHWITRTAWLYGVHGKSFPNTILTAAETRDELKVVSDQRGSPTYTGDLAEALVRLIRSPFYGTYHVTNSGEASWYEFASKAVELAGFSHVKVVPIKASEWPTPTKRPANSVLRNYTLELQGEPPLRRWEEALAEYVQKRAEHRRGQSNPT